MLGCLHNITSSKVQFFCIWCYKIADTSISESVKLNQFRKPPCAKALSLDPWWFYSAKMAQVYIYQYIVKQAYTPSFNEYSNMLSAKLHIISFLLTKNVMKIEIHVDKGNFNLNFPIELQNCRVLFYCNCHCPILG